MIAPITKMVTIIKTLADDPLQKPDPPVFDEPDGKTKENPNEMKTTELAIFFRCHLDSLELLLSEKTSPRGMGVSKL